VQKLPKHSLSETRSLTLAVAFMAAAASSPPPSPASLPSPARQHRCHARLADLAAELLALRLGGVPLRLRLWAACLSSAPGAEPTDAYLLDPADQALRWRPPQPAQSPPPPPPAAAAK
jgi:hypothetical protein